MTLAAIITPGHSRTGSNGNEGGTPHSLDLQNWNLTISAILRTPQVFYVFTRETVIVY